MRPRSNDPDSKRGLYRKYEVRRLDDPNEKHIDCSYYVLDCDHDRFAAPALRAYADACAAEYPLLARDLRLRAATIDHARDRAAPSPSATPTAHEE